jgi:hypothetical protein
MRCPTDGYPMDAVGELGSMEVQYVCTNPWHPHGAGPCPKCGSTGHHTAAGMGAPPEAMCAACGFSWQPSIEGAA